LKSHMSCVFSELSFAVSDGDDNYENLADYVYN